MKPKVGDLVRLKPLLVSKLVDQCDPWFATSRPDGNDFYVYQDLIEEILPRPLAVGDRVRYLYNKLTGRVVATRTNGGTRGDAAWVDWDDGTDSVTSCGELVRIEPT